MFYFPFDIWDVMLPIDELHFSRWLLHHHPDIVGSSNEIVPQIAIELR